MQFCVLESSGSLWKVLVPMYVSRSQISGEILGGFNQCGLIIKYCMMKYVSFGRFDINCYFPNDKHMTLQSPEYVKVPKKLVWLNVGVSIGH